MDNDKFKKYVNDIQTQLELENYKCEGPITSQQEWDNWFNNFKKKCDKDRIIFELEEEERKKKREEIKIKVQEMLKKERESYKNYGEEFEKRILQDEEQIKKLRNIIITKIKELCDKENLENENHRGTESDIKIKKYEEEMQQIYDEYNIQIQEIYKKQEEDKNNNS